MNVDLLRQRFRNSSRAQYLVKTELLARTLSFSERAGKNLQKDLLNLDDFGLITLEKQHQIDLTDLIEDRIGKKSTIITSHFPVHAWHEVIGG